MWPLISPASGAPVSAILALISEWPVFHISGLPPALAISSNSTWLALTSAMMVAPGWRLQHVARQDRSELVAPQDAALAVDHADAVAVAVEGDAEIAACSCDHLGDQLLQVLRHRRVGMVVREGAVDVARYSTICSPGSLAASALQDLAGRAVAGVPGDLQLALAAVIVLQQRARHSPRDVDLARTLAVAGSHSRPWRPSRPSSWICAPKNGASCPASS